MKEKGTGCITAAHANPGVESKSDLYQLFISSHNFCISPRFLPEFFEQILFGDVEIVHDDEALVSLLEITVLFHDGSWVVFEQLLVVTKFLDIEGEHASSPISTPGIEGLASWFDIGDLV